MTVKNPDLAVPPGLEVAGMIEYSAKTNQEQRDTIVVDIDGQEIPITLFAYPARADVSVDGMSIENEKCLLVKDDTCKSVNDELV